MKASRNRLSPWACVCLSAAALLLAACTPSTREDSGAGNGAPPEAKTAWGETIRLPEPYQTPSAGNGPTVIERPNDARVQVPEGFRAEVVAGGFEQPRAFLLGPSNEVLLTDAAPKGSVYVFTLGTDGKLSKPAKILDGLRTPYGMEYRDGYLYVAETTAVERYKYDTKARTVALPGEEVIDLSSVAGGHWTRNLLFNKDKTKLYLATGSRSNVDAGEIRLRASITRYNPDGSGQEYIAEGTRNPIGMEWNPVTGDLWAAVQERDALGDDLVPDYLTHIQPGGFTGGRTRISVRTRTRDEKGSGRILWRRRSCRMCRCNRTERCSASRSTPAIRSLPNTETASSSRITAPGTVRSGWGTLWCSSPSAAMESQPGRRVTSSPDSCWTRIRKTYGGVRWMCCNCRTAACS